MKRLLFIACIVGQSNAMESPFEHSQLVFEADVSLVGKWYYFKDLTLDGELWRRHCKRTNVPVTSEILNAFAGYVSVHISPKQKKTRKLRGFLQIDGKHTLGETIPFHYLIRNKKYCKDGEVIEFPIVSKPKAIIVRFTCLQNSYESFESVLAELHKEYLEALEKTIQRLEIWMACRQRDKELQLKLENDLSVMGNKTDLKILTPFLFTHG